MLARYRLNPISRKGLWGVECTLAVIGTGGVEDPTTDSSRLTSPNRRRGRRIYPGWGPIRGGTGGYIPGGLAPFGVSQSVDSLLAGAAEDGRRGL
eukprot:5998638-Pyramimonas_sp.AAC.1